MPKSYLLCHHKKDHNEHYNYNSVGDQQINREAYRLLTETKQTGLIKSESCMAMEVWQRNAALDFWLTSKDFAPVFILKSTTHWKAFHLHPKNLRLHRVFSKRFKSAINKFCTLSVPDHGKK